jgi:hypothetical protein
MWMEMVLMLTESQITQDFQLYVCELPEQVMHAGILNNS